MSTINHRTTTSSGSNDHSMSTNTGGVSVNSFSHNIQLIPNGSVTIKDQPIDFNNFHIPSTNLPQINLTDAPITKDITKDDGDENDIFELMEDLKSELKFTFEEESQFISQSNYTNSGLNVNPYIYNLPNNMEFQQNLRNCNQLNNQSIQKPIYTNTIDNNEIIYPSSNQTNYINNGQMNNYMLQDPNIIQSINNNNMIGIDQMNEMNMYFQQNPQMYMVNQNMMMQKNVMNQYSQNINMGNGNHRSHSHVKKPLNAFMLYMKDIRPKLIKETNTKDSIAINKLIGKMWQSLSKEDQAKYFEMARNEREIHRKLYPNYTSCDQYVISKKKRRKRDKIVNDGKILLKNNKNIIEPLLKKCRARFGLDNQDKWCKPCRRKKKCIRFLHDDENIETEIKNVNELLKESKKSPLPIIESKIINKEKKNEINDLEQEKIENLVILNTIQETLNSTIKSNNLQSNEDNSGSPNQNLLYSNLKSDNQDSTMFIPNHPSTFNESLINLLSNISPIPLKIENDVLLQENKEIDNQNNDKIKEITNNICKFDDLNKIEFKDSDK